MGELDKDRVAILNDYLLQITKEILDICDEVMVCSLQCVYPGVSYNILVDSLGSVSYF